MRRPTLVASGLAATFATTTLVAVAALGAAPATATPPVGPPSSSPSPAIEYTSAKKVDARSDGVRLKIPKDGVVRDFTLTYTYGQSSGWHQHPGLVLATVVSGSVYRTVPCQRPQKFSAGQVFVEVGPHFVENLNAEDAVLSITQIAPAGTTGAAFREDLPAPSCAPHPHPTKKS
jgi:quercetin dioxygenase-like cupin family protein